MDPEVDYAQQLAALCLAALDSIFEPRTQAELSEMQELRASGVSEDRVRSLYPLSGETYELAVSRCDLTPKELEQLAKLLDACNFSSMRLALKSEYWPTPGLTSLGVLADLCLQLAESELDGMLSRDAPYMLGMQVGDIEALLAGCRDALDGALTSRQMRSRGRQDRLFALGKHGSSRRAQVG